MFGARLTKVVSTAAVLAHTHKKVLDLGTSGSARAQEIGELHFRGAGFLIYWFSVYAAISLAGLTPKSIVHS